MTGAPYVHRSLRPPTQRLVGSGFVFEFNADTASDFPAVRLKRRARRLLAGGVVSGRVETVCYEVAVDGGVTRIDKSGERKEVPDRHAEHRWVRDAQRWLWKRTFEGRRAAGSRPSDLIGWDIAAAHHEE